MQQIIQRLVHDGESHHERCYEEQAGQRLGHQNRSGNSNATIMNMVSNSATTKPTAFSALTTAAQPQNRQCQDSERQHGQQNEHDVGHFRPLIPVNTPAIRHPCQEAAKPPSRVSYAERADCHGISTHEPASVMFSRPYVVRKDRRAKSSRSWICTSKSSDLSRDGSGVWPHGAKFSRHVSCIVGHPCPTSCSSPEIGMRIPMKWRRGCGPGIPRSPIAARWPTSGASPGW